MRTDQKAIETQKRHIERIEAEIYEMRKRRREKQKDQDENDLPPRSKKPMIQQEMPWDF